MPPSAAASPSLPPKTTPAPNSLAPFMAGAAEIDLDPETGKVTLVGVRRGGGLRHPAEQQPGRVQTEGGLVQGIGMALTETVRYNPDGSLIERNFLQYKIPTRQDICPHPCRVRPQL